MIRTMRYSEPRRSPALFEAAVDERRPRPRIFPVHPCLAKVRISAYLLNSIEILELRSFHANPAGYIAELRTSVGIAAFSGLNFVQMRHCKGGTSPSNRTRYTGIQCLASSNRMTMAELQHAATTRLVADRSSIL
jgi:hypothetical protein